MARCGTGEVLGAAPRVGPFNPALLAWQTRSSIIVSAVPAPFGLPTLARGGVVATLPFWGTRWSVGLQAARAGTSHRLSGRVSWGGGLAENAAAGIHLGMASWQFPRYASVAECEAGVGVLLRSGTAVSGAKITLQVQEGRPVSADDVVWGVGCGMVASEDLEVTAEAIQGPFVPPIIRCAGTVRPFVGVELVLAWADVPGSVGGGCGFDAGAWNVFVGVQWHPLLGWTQALDLRVRWE